MAYKCVVTCDCCGDTKVEWGRTMASSSAQEYLRSRGWKVGRSIGWVCPSCVEKGVWRE